MQKICGLLVMLLLVSFAASAQASQTPYAGQEKRAIKALSADDIEAYLKGEGMGLAKAAELNHYPGPKHVLQMAAQLQLSEKQIAETQKTFDKMHAEAVRLGRLIVDKEKELDDLFAKGEINSNKLQLVSGEIARLQGDLRVVHLRVHLEMKQILSAEQIRKYDELRGYRTNGRTSTPDEHRHGKH